MVRSSSRELKFTYVTGYDENNGGSNCGAGGDSTCRWIVYEIQAYPSRQLSNTENTATCFGDKISRAHVNAVGSYSPLNDAWTPENVIDNELNTMWHSIAGCGPEGACSISFTWVEQEDIGTCYKIYQVNGINATEIKRTWGNEETTLTLTAGNCEGAGSVKCSTLWQKGD